MGKLHSPGIRKNGTGKTFNSGGFVKDRHDYLPFGEEIGSYVSGRSNVGQQDYKVGNVRQKFAQKERDVETGLDYSVARYYASTQGRFTSPDPPLSSGKPAHPQSWNRYTYCLNHPLVLVDPDGLIWGYHTQNGINNYEWYNTQAELEAAGATVVTNFVYYDVNGNYTALNPNAREGASFSTEWEARKAYWRYTGMAASWYDIVPVGGQGRHFIFNYGVGNYGAALGNFFMMAVEGGTMGAGGLIGASEAAAEREAGAIFEGGVLRFSQKFASPFFHPEGDFAGRTIGEVASDLRSGALSPRKVPVGVVDGADGVRLIVNTRSSLALRRAGIPQRSWNIIDLSSSPTVRSEIQQRLINNELTNSGTDVLYITRSGLGKNASNLK